MHTDALSTVTHFTEETLPDLDVVTLAALELFAEADLPSIDRNRFARPLVVGSGNAIATARNIFAGREAVFADESSFASALERADVDGAYIFSASGSKHAVAFATQLAAKEIPTVLVTNTSDSPAAREVPSVEPLVFPKNREPYTYNTSTYMGMYVAATGESATDILAFIADEVEPLLTDAVAEHGAYYLLVPERFETITHMFTTKFDELFGPMVVGRSFTYEQTKHAKTVVESDDELFISFGVENAVFGKNKLHIPLPPDADYATIMAVGYYVIGRIQRGKEPYFKKSIARYMKEASALFGRELTVIVE